MARAPADFGGPRVGRVSSLFQYGVAPPGRASRARIAAGCLDASRRRFNVRFSFDAGAESGCDSGGFAAWRRAGDSPCSRSTPVDSRNVGISSPHRLGLQRAMASDFSRVGKAPKPSAMDRGSGGLDIRGGGDAWRNLVVGGRLRFRRNHGRIGIARIYTCAPARENARSPSEFPHLCEALLRLAGCRRRSFCLGGSRGICGWHLGSFASCAYGWLSRGDGIRHRTTNSAGILRSPGPFQPRADVRIAIIAERRLRISRLFRNPSLRRHGALGLGRPAGVGGD